MSLGVECGATGTTTLLASDEGKTLQRNEFGPANFNLLTEAQLISFFEIVKEALPKDVLIKNVGVGMPGIGDAKAKEVRISNLILKLK